MRLVGEGLGASFPSKAYEGLLGPIVPRPLA